MASGFAKPALSLSTGRFPPGLRVKARAGFFYPLRRYCIPSILFLSLLSLLFSCGKDSPCKPREPGWTSLGFEDHWALELELDWPYLYACAADEGLFRTSLTTPGSEWQYLGLADTSLADTTFGHYLNRGVQDVVLLESGAIIAGVSPGIKDIPRIYRSSDDGASWNPSGTCLPGSNDPCIRGGIYQLQRSPCHAGVVIAGSTLPIYRSATEGSTWVHVWGRTGTGLGVHDIEFHSRECNIIYAGGETSWFFPFLVKSVDDGISWEQIDFSDVVSYDNVILSIAMHPVDADLVYVGMMGAVLKTSDGGSTWTSGAFASCASGHFRDLAIDGENPLHMFAACGEAVLESWDGGETCDEIGDPIQSLILDMDHDSRRGDLYVGTMEGVFRYKWR